MLLMLPMLLMQTGLIAQAGPAWQARPGRRREDRVPGNFLGGGTSHLIGAVRRQRSGARGTLQRAGHFIARDGRPECEDFERASRCY